MPWGWECREKLIKQRVLPPTQSRKQRDIPLPGPNHYEPVSVVGKPGFSKIKRQPAYSFGLNTKNPVSAPAAKPTAKLYNTRGICAKGSHRIPGCVISPRLEGITEKTKMPGPAHYGIKNDPRQKRAPAYSIRQLPRPPYEPSDMWTPPPNMYLPPLTKIKKSAPAYSMGSVARTVKSADTPGPGQCDPKFEYVMRKKPAYSFGYPFREPKGPVIMPAPNEYCEKKFNISKPTIPAPTFGIRHSQYLGETTTFEKPSKLEIKIAGAV